MGLPKVTNIIMSLLPYTSAYGYDAHHGYGHPYGAHGYGYGYPGAYPYGPYGMTAEEIQKVREAEEKAFNEAEAKRKEFMEAEKKKYEEFVAAEKKKYEDYVSKEKELAEKLGPYAYGPYGPAGAYGYGYGYGHHGYGYPYAGFHSYGRGYYY